MLVMTAKIDKKKIVILVSAALAVAAALILIFSGGREKSTPTASVNASNNNARVEFLKSFGWEVAASPTESGQVRIPESTTPVYSKYNDLQKSQGYDLTDYAGKTVLRYVYKISNFPNATQPVYATVLIYKNQVIGGDITDTSPRGKMQGFKPLQQPQPDKPAASSPTTPASSEPSATILP